MSLNTFIDVNLPYGMEKTSEKEWIVFNRDRVPLGWNKTQRLSVQHNHELYSDIPIVTRYKTLTDEIITEIIHDESLIRRRKTTNEIYSFTFYDEKTTPLSSDQKWDSYIEKLRKIAKFETNFSKNDPIYQEGFLNGKKPTA